MNKVGFLGLGIMGAPMALNLVRAGFDVTVWNRSHEKCDALVAAGAKTASCPREVVASCDVTFAILSDPAAARDVCFGPDGVLEGAGPNHDYIDASTVDDATTRRIADALHAKGARYLEAPVSGTKKPAEDGTLIFLTAGDQSLYEDAAPMLDKMGKKRVFLGSVGQGARMKLVVNMIMGSMMTALGEGMALGQKGGLSGDAILDVLDAGAMACPMFKGKGAMIVAGSYPTSFPLKHMQKDLRLALALGDDLNQPLPCAAVVNETYKKAMAKGLADADMSAVASVVPVHGK